MGLVKRFALGEWVVLVKIALWRNKVGLVILAAVQDWVGLVKRLSIYLSIYIYLNILSHHTFTLHTAV